MKSAKSFQRKLGEIRRKVKENDYCNALELTDGLLEAWPGAAPLHVLRAELIQLQDENGPPLEEAKQSLRRAGELDQDSVAAIVERGHFELAVEDDAQAAAKTLAKAVAAARRLMVDALLGQAAALEELERPEEAFDCLAHAKLLQATNGASHASRSQREHLLDRWQSLSRDS